MTIHNQTAYIANLWDWGFLDGCFGHTRIKITDLDGLVERNRHFLFIEAKSPGKEVPLGQRILFDHLIENEANTVLVIWGEPNKPMYAQIWGSDPFSADVDTLQRIVSDWFRMANGQPLGAQDA